MDDDSKTNSIIKMGLCGLGLGVLAPLAILHNTTGLWIALGILVLGLLLFGGYFLWKRAAANRESTNFRQGLEDVTGAPKTVSDPQQRAKLDDVRRKFQKGLQEFKSRGKDIYKLPWFVIIGESGSGKTEAIRHSGIDFPPGLQEELQGSGGTINMDWWFTNRGIILDTAGAMIFRHEALTGKGDWQPSSEWREFLKLLKKSRPQCPINGLMLVLSTESLIKDSADLIARKSSILAQQLDLIQRTLDVRFPVYMLVTKSDLMEGFREFSDSISDPLMQHQMFGWSNPDPLDAPFRPDLIEQHLEAVAEKVRRRRLALLRESSAGDTQLFFRSSSGAPRASDGTDSLFALPASIKRLAPRLRRYLETIFVAGEWSAKPVFLRGVYFTSSMREGSALDEALALASGLPLDQLPEARERESKAFFLRDLFHEKIFRESGLVTRATNTLRMLRQKQLLIFGSVALALLLVLVFAWFGYRNLQDTVGREASYWKAGTTNWTDGHWDPGSLVEAGTANPLLYSLAAQKRIPGPDLPVVDYYSNLFSKVSTDLAVSWIFGPFTMFDVGEIKKDRPLAASILFERGLLEPLVDKTRKKMASLPNSRPAPDDKSDVARHRDALRALMRLETDRFAMGSTKTTNVQEYLHDFVTYLTEKEYQPEPVLADLSVKAFSTWPPPSIVLTNGTNLANNPAINRGLEAFRRANQKNESNIVAKVIALNTFVDQLDSYRKVEKDWLAAPAEPCDMAKAANRTVEGARLALLQTSNTMAGTNTIGAMYQRLQAEAEAASGSSFSDITSNVPPAFRDKQIFVEIAGKLKGFATEAKRSVETNYQARQTVSSDLDRDLLGSGGFDKPAYQNRQRLYQDVCDLLSNNVTVTDALIGDQWREFKKIDANVAVLSNDLVSYRGPLKEEVLGACNKLSADKILLLQDTFVAQYLRIVKAGLSNLTMGGYATVEQASNAAVWFTRIAKDLAVTEPLGKQAAQVLPLKPLLDASVEAALIQQAGFPVRLINTGRTMGAADLKILQAFASGLGTELGGATRANYAKIASDLLEQDVPIQGTLSFVTPSNNEEDIKLVAQYKLLLASPADLTAESAVGAWKDDLLVSGEHVLLSSKIDSPLFIPVQYQHSRNDTFTKIVSFQDWGFIRLINYYKGKPSAGGKVWSIEIPSSDPSTKGTWHFRLEFSKPLPTLDEWPK